MANWDTLKAAVAQIVKTNGNEEITGQLLQDVLNNIISNVGENATFKGVATPDTVPGTPDGVLFYFAYESGTYINFGALEIDDNSVYLIDNKSGSWAAKKIFDSVAKIKQLNSFGLIPELVYDGKYINSSGNLVDSVNYKTSDFIKIKNGSSVYISNNNTVGSLAYACALYDEEFVFVKELENFEVIEQGGYVRVSGENAIKDYFRIYYDAITDVLGINKGYVLVQELDLKRNMGAWIPKDSSTTLTYSNGSLIITNTTTGVYKGAFGGGLKTDDAGVKYLAVFEAKRNSGIGDWYLTMSQIGGDSSKLKDLTTSYKRFVIELEVLETNKQILLYSPDAQIQEIEIKNFYYVRNDTSEYERIRHLLDISNTINSNANSNLFITDLPNYGYLNTSGVYVAGDFNHYTSDFIKVDTEMTIGLSNVSVGALAIKCAFYTDVSESSFVSALNDSEQIPENGYVRFCGQIYDDESFSLIKTISQWNNQIRRNTEEITNNNVEKELDSLPKHQIINELSDILNPEWMGKNEFRQTDIEPSINTKGNGYLYDNGGTIELRIVKDAETIVSIPIASSITPLAITPFVGTWYARGDSITYGVGATTKYIDRVVTLLNSDGHTITVTNGGISGQDAEQLYNNNISSPVSSHDIASLMVGINDIEHWVANNGIGLNDDLQARGFREWYRKYLNLLIDIIIDQTSCSKFFLIVPTPQIIAFVDPDYLPSQNRYVANPLMQIVIQECIRAYDLRKGNGIVWLCRGDYYLKDATTSEIPDRIHPNDTGAALLAKGVRDEMTYRI